jgi:hypothetical protein
MNANRQMRIFLSSTFRDMHAEREHLIKKTFPRIQRLCEARGVVWSDVDLRWGITDEKAAEGNVLATCLEEIRLCRPFFIGLLGERYGSAANISEALLERQPWLFASRECSLTELEILHGVLNEPTAAEHALFYFRDISYLDRLPEGADPADFRSEDATATSKVRDLKERLRKSGVRVREPYRDVEELGAWVEADLCRLLDHLFPLGADYDPVAAAHLQFAAQRRRNFVGREEELRSLNEMLSASSAVLVTGIPGVGLSSVLANWAAAWRQSHPGTLVVEHYVGAHPGATSLDGCCRQLCLGLAAARNLPPPSVAIEHDWPDLFVEQLALAGAERPVVLVIDGADSLKGRGESAGAEWLPSELPPGVLLVASAGLEAVLALESRGWPLLRIAELSKGARAELVRRYLAVSGKELSTERIQQIATTPATGKPFHLALLLDDLRQYGEHATLGHRLSELLAAPDVFHLCDLVFRRCERDVSPDFTRGALGLLTVARFGLSDVELCELLGGSDGRLPQRPWSDLQISLQAMLVSRDGVAGFAQSEPARVAWKRYVGPPARELELHRRLADYFLARPDTPRSAVELPFHLKELAAWDELATWLSRAEAFRIAWHLAPEEVCATWRILEERSPRRAAEASKTFPADLQPAALSLLRELGHWPDALVLARQAMKMAQAEDDPGRQLETLLTVGEIELATGSPYAAEEVFTEAEEHATRAELPRELLRALRGHAKALDGQKTRVARAARPEISRRSRWINDRTLRIRESTQDAQLQNEALVLWLEDLEDRTGDRLNQHDMAWNIGMRDKLELGGSFVRAMGLGQVPGVEAGLTQFNRTVDERLQRLDTDAVRRLRYTRHRSLALRADLTIAKAAGDRARTLRALEALRQHAVARDDTSLLASVYEGFATQHQGAEKLAWLERQAGLLEHSGWQAALVSNRFTQARLIARDPNRRTEALALMRRAARDRPALPSRRERWRVLVYFFLLNERFSRAAIWLFVPLVLWGIWRFCLWTATWFGRLPLLGLLAYLFAAILAFPVLFFLLLKVSAMWTALRQKLPPKRVQLAKESKPSTAKPAAVRTEPPRPPSPTSHKPSPSAKLEDPQLPKWLTVPFVLLGRYGRGMTRSIRIGKRLGLDQLPGRLAWFALAVPVGSALTLWNWRASGCSRLLLLPLALAGQILIVGAVLGLISGKNSRWASGRARRLGRSGESRIGLVCLLALIRLKRRLLSRRRRPRKRRP